MTPPSAGRDRDLAGKPRSARPRDALGRPLGRGEGSGPTGEAPALPPAAALVRAQELLDSGQPFAAHEVLEAVWKATDGEERELWRGLAQVAVGITHALRGNDTGARALLERGAASLAPFATTTPHGIDVDGIARWARDAAADPSKASDPPRLRRPS
jgi:hypothetical protein